VVDREWLSTVRKKNRSQLGMGGMGMSVADQIAANYEARRKGYRARQPESADQAVAQGNQAANAASPYSALPSSPLFRYGAVAVGLVVIGALGFGIYKAVKR
jgi:hypothetical protein